MLKSSFYCFYLFLGTMLVSAISFSIHIGVFTDEPEILVSDRRM